MNNLHTLSHKNMIYSQKVEKRNTLDPIACPESLQIPAAEVVSCENQSDAGFFTAQITISSLIS